VFDEWTHSNVQQGTTLHSCTVESNRVRPALLAAKQLGNVLQIDASNGSYKVRYVYLSDTREFLQIGLIPCSLKNMRCVTKRKPGTNVLYEKLKGQKLFIINFLSPLSPGPSWTRSKIDSAFSRFSSDSAGSNNIPPMTSETIALSNQESKAPVSTSMCASNVLAYIKCDWPLKKVPLSLPDRSEYSPHFSLCISVRCYSI
jgi:hypothetical protein